MMFWDVGRLVAFLALGVAVVASIAVVLPRAAAWGRRARVTALLSGLCAWALAPFWAIPDGIAGFDRHPDPTYAYVAQQAYNDAWMHNDNPIARLALPAVRVVRVWRDPGHCPPSEPGGREPYADWRAEVRFYTYFGIPGPLLRVTCGGWAWGSA
jgi:hypothetical protein